MKYYPKSRIIENQKSNPGQFTTADGKPYSGLYYKTFDGKTFTGANPNITNSRPLIPVIQPKNLNPRLSHDSNSTNYRILNTNPNFISYNTSDPNFSLTGQATNSNILSSNPKILSSNSLPTLIDPTHFTPIPSEADYKAGKITRYIARQRNGTQFKVMEISKQTHEDLTNLRGGANSALWKSVAIFWQISGPLRNEKINNITTRAGIIDTNQRILDTTEKNFIGIKQYLSDLQQFARVS